MVFYCMIFRIQLDFRKEEEIFVVKRENLDWDWCRRVWLFKGNGDFMIIYISVSSLIVIQFYGFLIYY